MQPIIKVENLGKSYIIGHQREKYVALRDVLANKAKQTFSNAKKFLTGGQLIAGNELEEFWALKDINFEVNQGDRVGIIGRNGAGKSTLLKVLSRITEPTTGRIHLKGRVASLLEVGTGFHPELSGRENIFLNGAILGMGRAEVRKKFDEIVDFAGVEKFLDTPVKRYSSGMYVRLAFAVAAHLEPEILIIDEVLAVGDAEFQKKCLGKMEDVSKNDGRTVLFVSHNMEAIKKLCTRGILLDNGQNSFDGETEFAISNYYSSSVQFQNNEVIGVYDLTKHRNKKDPRYGILKAELYCNGHFSDIVYSGSKFELKIFFESSRDFFEGEIGIVIKDCDQVAYIGINNKHIGNSLIIGQGKGTSLITIEDFPLFASGDYWINLYFGDDGPGYEILENAIKFQVIEVDTFGSGRKLDPNWNKIFHKKIKIVTT